MKYDIKKRNGILIATVEAESLKDAVVKSRANLSWANLSRANLSGANLSGADLSEANLSGTQLDSALIEKQRAFCKSAKPNKHGGRIVYRTATSNHIGSTEYAVGLTYIAPNLSFASETECHPGIYVFASLDEAREKYPEEKFVRCYVRDGEWVITAKGNAIARCKRIRVLSEV